MTYSELLRDPRWQKLRLEILQAANWKCEDCGGSDKSLEVHHCAYPSGKNPWECPAELLMAVCESCHIKRQKFENSLREDLGKICRFMSLAELEDEAFRLVREIADRQTARMAAAFGGSDDEG